MHHPDDYTFSMVRVIESRVFIRGTVSTLIELYSGKVFSFLFRKCLFLNSSSFSIFVP